MMIRQTRRFTGLFAAAAALFGASFAVTSTNPAALLSSAFVPATTTTVPVTAVVAVLPSAPAIDRLGTVTPEMIDSETLWLARCIYSETKRPAEQELVAWVIRNRVETGYRGESTYEGVVLDPYQFSAFIRGTSTYARYSALTPETDNAGFQKALAIAHFVRHAPDMMRPFDGETRHFYSEQSMVGGRTPAWAVGKVAVAPARDFTLEAKRFRFYTGLV